MRTPILSAVTLGLCVITGSLAAAEQESSRELVTRFWSATTPDAQAAAAEALSSATGDVSTLYRWLKAGPEYAADVPRGYVESVREDADGTRFRYVVLIPASYDPSRAYPVEFILHGGVGRPEWGEGGQWWRRGYESLESEDRITVVPAAWDEAFWWHTKQADNIPALLRRIKQQYHVDDNRVYLSGVSDGGTGAFFFAFKQTTDWAAFMPYIGHPGVLQNPASGGGYRLYFENLLDKPLYIVNGENDPLYPSASIAPFVNELSKANIEHTFRVIPGGGHNTEWLPEETPAIEQFKQDNPRAALRNTVQWVTDSTDRFNRNHWLRIDDLEREGEPGFAKAERDGNVINVTAIYVDEVTLLLSPEEVDFSQPMLVYVNGTLQVSGMVQQDAQTLLRWARSDYDRSMLFTAELHLTVSD